MKLTLFITLFALACTQQTPEQNMVVNPNASASKYTFLSLGDSYTIGESVPEADRWSVQLGGLLRKEGVDVGTPDIIARTGWTTAELQNAIKSSGNQKTYDLVSLMIGVNNQYRGKVWIATEPSLMSYYKRRSNLPGVIPATFSYCPSPTGGLLRLAHHEISRRLPVR